MSNGAFRFAAELEHRRATGLFRDRRLIDDGQAPTVHSEGRMLTVFCSNDYLGLASDPRLVDALQRGAARYGVGSGASHLVCGHQRPHAELEEALAEFTGRERALVFSSGYAANLGVPGALLGRGDAIFQDRLNHASLLDGALLCGARLQRYPHADADALATRLASSRARRMFVATDGVFSMDGDEAPLARLAHACASHGALLYVDDAHGFGVLGHRGGGCLEQQGIDASMVPLLMGTLGKALGCSGAFVAGERDLIETLVQHARTYIYTTALPPAVAVAALESLRITREEGWRRLRLQELIKRFRAGAERAGITLLPSRTPIQPIMLGDPERALSWSRHLLERGLLVTAIRPPTVPPGSSRLRVTLSAMHTDEQLDRLLEALAEMAS